MMLGGVQYITEDGPSGNIIQTNGIVRELTLRSGAVLSAPEVFLLANSVTPDAASRLIVEQGAGINTIGKGRAAYDSADGFIYGGSTGSLVAVSNGVLSMLPVLTSIERSEEHTSELQSLMSISLAVFCLKKKDTKKNREEL